jgi:hypothetical protein
MLLARYVPAGAGDERRVEEEPRFVKRKRSGPKSKTSPFLGVTRVWPSLKVPGLIVSRSASLRDICVLKVSVSFQAHVLSKLSGKTVKQGR